MNSPKSNPDFQARGARRGSEFDAMIRGASRAFKIGEDFFRSPLKAERGRPLHATRIGLLNGEVVGGCNVIPLTLRIGGVNVPTAGIADVHVNAEHRARGFALKILEDTVAYMRERDYLFSLLYSDYHGFYGKFGWTPLARNLFVLPAKPGAVPAVKGPSVSRVRLEDITDELKKLHKAAPPEQGCALVRSRKYWNAFVAAHEHRKHVAFITRDNGRATGVCVVRKDKNKIWINECHGDATTAQALLRAAVSEARRRKCDTVQGHFSGTHPMARAILEHGGREQRSLNLMGNIIAPAELAALWGHSETKKHNPGHAELRGHDRNLSLNSGSCPRNSQNPHPLNRTFRSANAFLKAARLSPDNLVWDIDAF